MVEFSESAGNLLLIASPSSNSVVEIFGMANLISPEKLQLISEIALLALSGDYESLNSMNYIDPISSEYVQGITEIVSAERYRIPETVSIEMLQVKLFFEDGRGHSAELSIPVEKRDDDLSRIVLGFEILNSGDVKITYAYWR